MFRQSEILAGPDTIEFLNTVSKPAAQHRIDTVGLGTGPDHDLAVLKDEIQEGLQVRARGDIALVVLCTVEQCAIKVQDDEEGAGLGHGDGVLEGDWGIGGGDGADWGRRVEGLC